MWKTGKGWKGCSIFRFARMVPGLKGLDYGARLEMLNLMTLEERRNRSDLVELFKISKGLSGHSKELILPCGQFTKNKRTR